KELPLLRKGELEACQVDLFLIGFDGREVWEQRAIHCRGWGERVAGVDARLRVRCDTILQACQAVRHDLGPIEGWRYAERCQATRLRNSPLVVERTAPEAQLQGSATTAAEVDAPCLT